MNALSAYDEIADMYHALWADWYLPAALPALERVFFTRIPTGARILDLCCGSGHVTRELVRRGYAVTGIDSSAELIALARKILPGADLRIQDARRLQLDRRHDAVISTFDSLNHMMTVDELSQVFRGVYRALEPGGLFAFDMNLEDAYLADLREWIVDVTDDSVGLVRGTYHRDTRKAVTELIWFVRSGADNLWKQRRSVIEQRCYSQSEILLELAKAAFTSIEAVSASEAGMRADVGYGRLFFVART